MEGKKKRRRKKKRKETSRSMYKDMEHSQIMGKFFFLNSYQNCTVLQSEDFQTFMKNT